MMNLSTCTLDHIVHLTPPGSVEEASNQFRELGFTVIPGGTHTGGLTANALVVFADGVYLELISFTHPPSYYPPGSPERKARDSNRWASKYPGWIDFAFLGNGSSTTNRISDIINERANREGSGVVYNPEVAGGRQRPDGKVLKWVISSSNQDNVGKLPFFCGDVTPREWRVPSDPPENIKHPSNARGISHILMLSTQGKFSTLTRQLTSVIGHSPLSLTDTNVIWKLNTHQKGTAPHLILKVIETQAEAKFAHECGTGIFEVGFLTGGTKSGSASTPYGRIVWTTQ